MASTTKFGSIETRIRRDLVNDNDADQYRWSVSAVMSAMNQAVKDIVFKINAWAGYLASGAKVASVNTALITSNCDGNPPSETLDSSTISTLRNTVMPLDDRYSDAVAYLAASKLYLTDDSDTANAQKAATFLQLGQEIALR